MDAIVHAMRVALLLPLLLQLLPQLVFGVGEDREQQLGADDECIASDSCALNALQRTGRRKTMPEEQGHSLLQDASALVADLRRLRRKRATIRRALWLHRQGGHPLTHSQILTAIQVLRSHHSADFKHIAHLRRLLALSQSEMTQPWRCVRCWKVASPMHVHCTRCGGRWDKFMDQTYKPPDRPQTPRAQESRQVTSTGGWDWKWEAEEEEIATPKSRQRSASNKPKNRRRRRKKKDAEEDVPVYTAPALPAPWTAMESQPKRVTTAPSSSTVTTENELILAQQLKDAYPNPDEMPDTAKAAIAKAGLKADERLRADMHRTTDILDKSRQTFRKLQEARRKHREAWLAHLKKLIETLKKQTEAFQTQQQDYIDRIKLAQKEIHTSRRTMQKLNAQAAIKTTTAPLEEDDEDEVQILAVASSDDQLRTQIQELLQQAAALVDDTPIDIKSELGSDDHMEDERQSKRQRSQEPPGSK
eukprot:s1754_g10.t1